MPETNINIECHYETTQYKPKACIHAHLMEQKKGNFSIPRKNLLDEKPGLLRST